MPTTFTLKDVMPSIGSTVPNENIVQTFTIAGQLVSLTPTFGLPAAHTAGLPTPSPLGYTISIAGADSVYTSLPVTWANVGHVEEAPISAVQNPSTGCVFELPVPVFSYDVTAP